MKIEDILAERSKKNKEIFYVDSKVISSYLDYELIRKKHYIGIRYGKEDIFEPIYDKIEILDNTTCILCINDTWAIADLNKGIIHTKFSYSEVKSNLDNFLSIKDFNGKQGLYDTLQKKEFLKTNYDEIGTPTGVEFIWTRAGNKYDFVEQESGKIISVMGLSIAYDSPNGMFGLSNYNNKVIRFNRDGYESSWLLREAVMKAGGYLRLQNHSHRVEHIIDVYGNILN